GTPQDLIDLTQSPSGRPAIESTICLGKIVSHTELDDDRHNVLLVGTQRARILSEIDAGRTFRIADVEILDDVYPPEGNAERPQLKTDLLDAFSAIIPSTANVQKNLHDLMAGQMGLGPISDIVGYTLPFAVNEKLELLGTADVDSRARRLIELLGSGTIELHSVSVEEQSSESESSSDGMMPNSQATGFPPPFSMN
ncbi:MAG: LON peptidase substrate-binding domain-containing protein, partial [Planctomycetota bacterium]